MCIRDRVTHGDVQKWIAGIKLAPASVRKIHRVFSQVLATAVRDGRLTTLLRRETLDDLLALDPGALS